MLLVETPPNNSDVQHQESFSLRRGNVDIEPKKLYTSAEIGVYDVLCGRDKAAFNNVGNRRFRITVSLSLQRYLKASTRKDKSVVIKSVVLMLYADGGKFLQQISSKKSGTDVPPLYIELNEKQAHEKAGHALRDMAMMRSKPSVSKKNKAADQPAMTFLVTSATRTTTTSSSTSSESNKRMKRSETAQASAIGQVSLPQQLDAWTELTWDESSELTHDETIFDTLVQSVAVNNITFQPTANAEVKPIGMIVEHDSKSVDLSVTDGILGAFDNISNDADVDRTLSNMTITSNPAMAHKSTLLLPRRSSSDSFAFNDEMVSWLVGESDFVLQI